MMAKEKLPRLTEAMVRALANDKSFERGKDYYRGGAISETAIMNAIAEPTRPARSG